MSDKRVILDADHKGQLLVTINRLLNIYRMNIEGFLDDTHNSLEDNVLSLLDLFYFAGNVEGRLISDNATEDDLEWIDKWDEEHEFDENVPGLSLILALSVRAVSIKEYNTQALSMRMRRKFKGKCPGHPIKFVWTGEELDSQDKIPLVVLIRAEEQQLENVALAMKAILRSEGLKVVNSGRKDDDAELDEY